MPELPEVETIRQGLQQYLAGYIIQEVYIHDSRIFTGDKDLIFDSLITRIERFGKGLVIVFENEYALAIHLKMTGQLIYQSPEVGDRKVSKKEGGKLPNKYSCIIFFPGLTPASRKASLA